MYEETLMKLQVFTKQTDLTEVDAPVGITFTASGNVYVKYSLGPGCIFTGNDSLKKAIDHIEQWLNE